ncbi:HIT domain-containing protein [Marinobacter confluentis]|uniref:HIT domain-containing protein n=1 Tax=Marinobacter confluentis TaxID=1697557 RepID=A0A4Z1BNB2_9GAMM|nr:HIT family protein [Marinobacter confluentis]TGN41467.1 HIT domain-containing protein [Marinobacter confluentis]
MSSAVPFVLHEKLEADTIPLGHSQLCEVRLMNDSQLPWVLLVPRVADIREIYQLPKQQQMRLAEESSLLGEGMMDAFSGDKFNVAALGNMVPQLHLHHIVRFEGDPAWPGPVWGKLTPEPYDETGIAEFRARLRSTLDALK